MKLRFEERIGTALVRWVRLVCQHAVLVSAGFVCATLAAGFYAGTHLGILGGTDALLDADLPFKQAEQRYYEAFPILYENMFVVIDADTPERAGEAATALAERLRAEPELFRAVYLPGGGDFFEQHAFLYLDTAQLEQLADRLAEAQPFLAELARDGSLRGLAAMLTRGTQAVRDGDVGGDRLRVIFERVASALEASGSDAPQPVSWAEVLSPDGISVDARRRFLLMQPVLDFTSLQPARRPILEVRKIARELGLDRASGVTVRITGDVALSHEELDGLRKQAAAAGVASFLLVAAILIAALRSLRLTLFTLVTLIVGLVLTAGFTAVSVGHFNMISVAFAVLFIGLGVDFGIHFCMRYRELIDRGHAHAQALDLTVHSVGTSLVLCASTTAIGFFAFVPTDFLGVAELGLISGVGMFISLFCTLTLLPALLSLPPLPRTSDTRQPLDWSGMTVATLPLSHPRAVRTFALVVALFAIFVLPRARFDNNPLNVRDPSSESARTFAELLDKGSSSPWSLNAIAPDLASAEALAEKLRKLESVDRVVTVSDYVPEEQQEKLEIIEDVLLFLTPLPRSDEDLVRPSSDEAWLALQRLEAELSRLLADPLDPALTPAARSLRTALADFIARVAGTPEAPVALEQLETTLLGSLPEQLRTLEAALGAGRVTLENLPEALLQRMVAADGRARVEIFPTRNLRDQGAMARFVDEVRAIEPNVAGSASEIVESGRVVVTALRQALLAAVVAIALLLLVLWRRIDAAALVLAPLLLSAVLTVAAAVLLEIPFNFADVIVLPLLLGIGVDSGIHLVHRARTEGTADLLRTSTARAVAYSALTTIASFGTLGFASHRGLATLGQLLTLGVGITIVCNLVVLPALVTLHPPRPARASQRRYPGDAPPLR